MLGLSVVIGIAAAVIALALTAYAHRELARRLKNPRERWFMHVLLAGVALAFAFVSVVILSQFPDVRNVFAQTARAYQDDTLGWLFQAIAFIVAVGVVHIPPAAILYIKKQREHP